MYKRIVVKIGTKVLSNTDGSIDGTVLEQLVSQISALKKEGVEVILVSSGAVGAGKGLLTLQKPLPEVVQKQVYAAVGQVSLMNRYSSLFGEQKYLCAQVLATKEDFRDEQHLSNMKNCLEGLIHEHIVPVVNENDVVATTELMFTDNDELAGLVAGLLRADALIILTSVEGLMDTESGEVISEIAPADRGMAAKHISPDLSAGGRGGMQSKFTAASDAAAKGITVHIASGRRPGVLADLADGKSVGTVFLPL